MAWCSNWARRTSGQLDSAGIENLARLGRLGATLALRDVYLGGLDLAALRQLGVRFLNFPPHAVDAGNGPSEVWREFVQYARAMQIQLIVGDIETPQQAASASKCARFGHGPFFAPPRKVRRDAGVVRQPRPPRQRRLNRPLSDDAAIFRQPIPSGSVTSGVSSTMAWRPFPSPSRR